MLSFVFLVAGVAFNFGVAASAGSTIHRGTANTVKTVCKGNNAPATYQGHEDRNQVDAILRQNKIQSVWMPYNRSNYEHWLWANNTKAANKHIPETPGKSSGCAYIYLNIDGREVGSCSSQGFGYICEGKGEACSGPGIARGDCIVKGDRWFVYGCDVNNWYEARYRCEQMGTELATITSDQFIRDFKIQWIDNQKKKCVELWYGLHREGWGLDGTTEHRGDVSPSIHLLWDKGEPGDVNNCSVLHRDQRGVTSLRSADCVSEHNIICLSQKVHATTLEPETTTVTTVSTPIPCAPCSGLLVSLILVIILVIGILTSFFITREYCSDKPCYLQTFGRICGSKDKEKPEQIICVKQSLLEGEKKSTGTPTGTPQTPDRKIMMPVDDTPLHKGGMHSDETDSPGKPIQREHSTPESEKIGVYSISATTSHGAVGFNMKTIKPAVFTNISSDAAETKIYLRVCAVDDEKKEEEIKQIIDLEEPWIRQPSYIDISLDENYKGKLTTKVETDVRGWRITPTKETQTVEIDSIFYNYKKKDVPWKLLLDRCLTGQKESDNLLIAISYLVHKDDTMNGDWQSSIFSVNLEQCTAKRDKRNKMEKDEEENRVSLEHLNVKKHDPSIDIQADRKGRSKPLAKGNTPGDKTDTLAEIHPTPSHIGAYAKISTTAALGDTQTGSAGSRSVAGRADNVTAKSVNIDIPGHAESTDSGEEPELPESVRLLNKEKENSK